MPSKEEFEKGNIALDRIINLRQEIKGIAYSLPLDKYNRLIDALIKSTQDVIKIYQERTKYKKDKVDIRKMIPFYDHIKYKSRVDILSEKLENMGCGNMGTNQEK